MRTSVSLKMDDVRLELDFSARKLGKKAKNRIFQDKTRNFQE